MSTQEAVRRSLLSLDIQHYGEGDDIRQNLFQTVLTEAVGSAAREAGLDDRTWEVQRSGDGILAVLPDSEPESKLVDGFIRSLDLQLDRFNGDRKRRARLRLRIAIHHGPIAPARNGYVGEGVLTVSRLTDSDALRSALVDQRKANLAVAVTETVYSGTVARGHTTIDQDEFVRTPVEAKEFSGFAWIRVPGVRPLSQLTTTDDAVHRSTVSQTQVASSRWRAVAGRTAAGRGDRAAVPQAGVEQHAVAHGVTNQAGRDLIVNPDLDRTVPPTIVTVNEGDIRAENVNFGIQHGRSS